MAIRWDKFTVKSQEAIQQATELASQNGNPELLPIHILAALLQDREGIITPVHHTAWRQSRRMCCHS